MSIAIKFIEYYLPENILSNDELVEIFGDWTPDKIYKKTGIKSRHIVGQDEYVSDLARKAAMQLFKKNNINPSEINFILLGTQSPDYLLPTTACILQNELGIPIKAGALDFNLGCSAYIYGLALAKSLVYTGIANNVLLLTAETYTKHINPKDKSTRTIFGDGASATLISRANEGFIGEFSLYTDGSGYSNLIIPSSGMRTLSDEKCNEEIIDENDNVRLLKNLYMNGAEIFNFTIHVVPKVVTECLEKNKINMEDIDLFVFHQANQYMLDFLRKQINIPKEKFYVNIETIGNTVSSSIPIALKMAEHDGRLNKNDTVMLVGFGVGLSWGAVVVKY